MSKEAEDFRANRQTLGLSQKTLSDVLGCSERVVRMWENEERKVNPLAARMMGWMINGFRPPEFPS